ncbi:MAG: zinc ribbon domain-containing protein [Verrucomicrobia bacterium]|nr:zinc ribbon domain-containing protein [Verrucomicrobiota bacterium]
MAEVVSQNKFPCPACGAEATWNPAKQALVCGYCGTVSPASPPADAPPPLGIQEHDLTSALQSIPEGERGWKTERVEVLCQSCQAISVFEPSRVGQRCDFCGSSALVPHEQTQQPFRPESLLQFKISDTQVRDAIREWYGQRWFAPNALGTRAMTDQLHGVYLPYWTFDAQVHADWTAESGYYYYETESYTDSDGRRQTRQVRRIRWQWSSGSLDHFFDDELVCASKGVDHQLVGEIEPFPTEELKPYRPDYLAGWIVERYQIDLVAAAQHSREVMSAKLNELCARKVPGDTHRNLQVSADWSGQTFKHILVPVWLLTYQFHGTTYHVLVNGYTGAIAGNYPKSFWKILFAVLGVLLFVLIVVLLGRNL